MELKIINLGGKLDILTGKLKKTITLKNVIYPEKVTFYNNMVFYLSYVGIIDSRKALMYQKLK